MYCWADQTEFKELINTNKLPPDKHFMRNIVFTEVLTA